jgi:hypothetical protein
METDTGTYSFTAAVEEDNGHIVLSPVPERVSPGGIGYGVELFTSSIKSGWYIWGDHTITPVGTKVVRLTRLEEE